jgi:uncharacterized protein (TIGR03435 family)
MQRERAFPIVFLLCGLGQAADAPLTFEVASVRPAAPNPAIRIPQMYLARGGPGTADPGRIDYANMSMQELLRQAYGLKLPYQLSGPNWLENEKYDIVANVPAGVTREQFNVMLQNLLTDRFGMAVHHETREIVGYELSIAKGGPKFKESPAAPPATMPASGVAASGSPTERPQIKTEKDKDGKTQLAPGSVAMFSFGIPGGARHTARQQPISVLISVLEGPLGKPLVDKTGLTGKYDFNLEYARDTGGSAPGGPAYGADDATPDLFTALQDQLGLKLEQKKISMDVLVIDRAEKTPKEN